MSFYSSGTLNRIKALSSVIMPDTIPLIPIEEDMRDKCLSSFYEFTKWAWPLVEPDPYIDNWHIQALCDHMQAWLTKDIRSLIVNYPPRSAKTTICYVFAPAWGLLQDSTNSFLMASYSADLSEGATKRCRGLMQHKPFQRLFGDKLTILTGKATEIYTSRGGSIIARSTGGQLTGFGARFQMIDDPNNVTKIYYPTIRRRENENVDYIFGSRSRGTSPSSLLTQQRCDPDDCTAHVKRNNNARGWITLHVAEVFSEANACETIKLAGTDVVWRDPRRIEGELLSPLQHNEEYIQNARLSLGEAAFEAQYQQSPLLAAGNIIDPDWFLVWTHEMPPIDYIVQSWDTAFTHDKNEDSAYSACSTWGVFQNTKTGQNNAILIDIYTDRLSFPQLRQKAIDLWQKHDPDLILVEWQASGYSLVQELEEFNLPVQKYIPRASKETRCASISGFIESGFVWVPSEEIGNDIPNALGLKLMGAAQYFPKTGPSRDTRDIIDSMSQAFLHLADLYFLEHKPIMRRGKHRAKSFNIQLKEFQEKYGRKSDI